MSKDLSGSAAWHMAQKNIVQAAFAQLQIPFYKAKPLS